MSASVGIGRLAGTRPLDRNWRDSLLVCLDPGLSALEPEERRTRLLSGYRILRWYAREGAAVHIAPGLRERSMLTAGLMAGMARAGTLIKPGQTPIERIAQLHFRGECGRLISAIDVERIREVCEQYEREMA